MKLLAFYQSKLEFYGFRYLFNIKNACANFIAVIFVV